VSSLRMTRRASKQPFNKVLRDLMHTHEVSFRRLAEFTAQADPDGRGYKHTYLNHLAAGPKHPQGLSPTVHNMEIIARALDEDPRVFREYREHLAAQEAARLAAKVGLDEVLAALKALDRGD
jgi:hypothetical protein